MPASKFSFFIDKTELRILDSFFAKQIPQIRIAYIFTRFLGLRRSDAVRVKTENIHDDILIMTQFKTKNPIQLPLPKQILEYLKAYIQVFKHDIDEHKGYFAFSTRKKGHISAQTISTKYAEFRRKFAKELNIKPYKHRKDGNPLYRIKSHIHRHNIINYVYKRSGNDLLTAQTIAGHTRPSTTMDCYLNKPTPNDLRNLMESAFEDNL